MIGNGLNSFQTTSPSPARSGPIGRYHRIRPTPNVVRSGSRGPPARDGHQTSSQPPCGVQPSRPHYILRERVYSERYRALC